MRLGLWLAVLAAGAAVGCGGSGAARDELNIFAAASLREVARDWAAAFETDHSARVRFNFAGSNTLAQQIRAADLADVFVSADRRWVDELEREGLLASGWRRDVLRNRLVVAAHKDASLEFREVEDLARSQYRHLAVADPRAVPAGRYAQAALESVAWGEATLWQELAKRIVPTNDVRGALALVQSDPEILGIVYRTDAQASQRVRVLLELPETAETIVYCAAVTHGSANQDAARAFVTFLGEPAAREISRRHGFGNVS